MKPENVMTVTQLNRASNRLLSEHFWGVWVEGEISNLTQPASGHLYFSLKDANAQVRCAMFKTAQRKLAFKPENGKQVLLKAQVSLYEPRGDFQLIVEAMEASGDGALQRAFVALKQKLLAEGLFDAERKLPIPTLPKAIAVITSPTGAAIRDIITVLRRRFAAVPVIIYPVSVQGDNAQYEITKAIALANDQQDCDLIILGRGGGSLEDLWAFNEERVARAISASNIPIISAVGHETDVTIADFVADLRAATPSAAAEHAVPDQQAWLAQFQQFEMRLQQHQQRQLQRHQQALTWLSQRLQQQHPGQKLARNAQRLDELELRLVQAQQSKLRHQKHQLEAKTAQLWQHSPTVRLNHYQQQQAYLNKRLLDLMQRKLERSQQRLTHNSQTLHAVSPLAILNRGYALTSLTTTGQIIHTTEQLSIGDQVKTRLAQGSFFSQITGFD
ncbi:MAG: exodeoxyribonuclease VII large subunit [Methylococcales bacterium]|nr:exodeoxyribonuclease VII large subunit [Methylococcales bacterium]